MNKFFVTTLMIGGFLIGATNSYAQLVDDPVDKKVELDAKDLYEHGYNKDNAVSQDLPREARDSVMVGSTMNYFVMPDRNYNSDYYAQGQDYMATGLTKSEFVWAVDAASFAASITAQNPNGTGTSPWVKIVWGTTRGNAKITIEEVPVGVTGSCSGEEAEIPVTVISKPEIGFTDQADQGDPPKFEIVECQAADGSGNLVGYSLSLPVTVTTESCEIKVKYTLVHTPLGGVAQPSVEGTVQMTIVSEVNDGGIKTVTGILSIPVTLHGTYEVTIEEMTDRIARKCDVLGNVLAADEFTYSVLPQPAKPRPFHVPNNF
jgi:hypothetical protein